MGIVMMLAGILLFSMNDVLGKWLVSTYSVGQVMLIRSIAALAILTPLVWRMGLRSILSVERPLMQFARAALATAEAFFFYFAVAYMPLADVMTIWMAAPIYVAALSPFLLGERVGWRRWTAIVIGFCGVIVALDPSASTFTLPALVSVVGSLAFTFMMLSGRVLRGTPDTTLVFFQMVCGVVVGLATAPLGWITPTPLDFSLLVVLGCVAMLAHVCVNRSLKLAPAATVTPFQYTLILWGVIFGWFVFGDAPRPAMLVGAGIIAASGLFIFFREQKLKARAA
jgi:drug/metabolite transporter (DMT)-like permease